MSQTQLPQGKIIKGWASKKWKGRWEQYLDTVISAKRTPAHGQELGRQRDKLHKMAIQLRAKKAGFAAFLHARRVPDVVSPACHCG